MNTIMVAWGGSQDELNYLPEGPVNLHGPERNGIHVVDKTVRVRHLFYFINY